MKHNVLQIASYKQQLMELQVKYRFEGLDPQSYIIQYRAIIDRIHELEKLDDWNSIRLATQWTKSKR